MPLSLVIGPTYEPLTWAQAQKQCSLDGFDEDRAFMEGVLIPAARDRCELATRRALITQTWDYLLDAFPPDGYIEIPKPPLVNVAYVHYVDTAGVTQVLDPSRYLVQPLSGPRCARGRVALPFASVWPVTLAQMGAVTVRFVAGYGDAEDVPPNLISAMLLDVGSLYANREDIVMEPRVTTSLEFSRGCQSIYRSFRSRPTQRILAAVGC